MAKKKTPSLGYFPRCGIFHYAYVLNLHTPQYLSDPSNPGTAKLGFQCSDRIAVSKVEGKNSWGGFAFWNGPLNLDQGPFSFLCHHFIKPFLLLPVVLLSLFTTVFELVLVPSRL